MDLERTSSTEPADWKPSLPPWPTTETGSMRRVGVEIELIGPDVQEVASALAETLGGSAEKVSRYEYAVDTGEIGPWRVELDFAYLKEKGRSRAESGAPSGVEELAEAIVRTGAEAIVPVEIVSPPLPIPDLAGVQKVVDRLRRLGAHGTRAGITYAFGLHLNPEVPRRTSSTLSAYLKAFLCLHDWLVRESDVDLTRKLSRYMAPFPSAYVRRVIDPEYAPDLETLIDDYLQDNPTRNRALDLLPLFAELDEARVRGTVDDARVKPRPTFHYRLPNCEIDDPDWGLHRAWSNWLQVEHLAADTARLTDVCARYTEFLERPVAKWFGDWATEVEPWVLAPELL
tara:strand:- start:2454 stop:3482 length:1029 start_codon:yes stop_codon:yes gene_type:complete